MTRVQTQVSPGPARRLYRASYVLRPVAEQALN
jgi:hypothetical protein